jgi:hypothetical protein
VNIFHFIKADYIEAVFFLMRIVFLQFKDIKMIKANAVLNNPSLIPSLINALNELFNKIPYTKIKQLSLMKIIEEIIKNCIISVRNIHYFGPYQ